MKFSDAAVIYNKSMIRKIEGRTHLIGPRTRGLAFTKPIDKFYSISPNETIEVDGMNITGIKTTHGALLIKIGPFSIRLEPGKEERIGWGAISYTNYTLLGALLQLA